MSLLRVEGLEATYGKSQALFGVDLAIGEGEVVSLMGRNGVGKTTTVKAICRMVPATGTLVFDGEDLGRLPSFRAAQLGIGLVPEGRRCFRDLTVTENMHAAARPGHWDQKRIEGLFPRLAERRGQRAASLSGGEQQMLAIARALMTNPRLLLLDEATEGLAPLIRQEIWEAVRLLKAETGMAILLIDKSLKEQRAVSDRAIVLEKGRSVWNGSVADLSTEITERYIGV